MILQPFRAADEDHALFADRFLDVGINGLAVELRFHAGQKFPLLLRDAKALERAFYVVRHVLPIPFRLGPRAEVVTDVIENDRFQVLARPMRWHRLAHKGLVGVEAKLADPVGILLDVGNVVNRLLGQPDARVVRVGLRVGEIPDVPLDFQR